MKRAVKGLEVKAIFHDAKEQNCLHCWQTFSLWPSMMGKKKRKKKKNRGRDMTMKNLPTVHFHISYVCKKLSCSKELKMIHSSVFIEKQLRKHLRISIHL